MSTSDIEITQENTNEKSVSMKSEDRFSHIVHKLESEIKDANEYCKMAKKAEEMGECELAKNLYEIYYDEYTHAYFIYHFLRDKDYDIPNEICEKYEDLVKDIHYRFQR